MKGKLFRFLAFIFVPVVVCFAVVFYYKVAEFKSDVWQSKAIIAQIQPQIIAEKSQADINRAVAFSVYTNSAITAFAVGVPYLIILLYTFYKLLKFGVENYEKLRIRTSDTANG
jgi:putative effector of murein hydrolase